MTTHTQAPETALQKEKRLFDELASRLLDTLLSQIFDLSPEKASRRLSFLTIGFLISGFLVSIIHHPLSLWMEHIRDILYSILAPSEAPIPIDVAFTNFFDFIVQVVFDPRSLQYLPIFLAPFFIALQSAAIYLADVFELEDVAVARNFINSVALFGSDSAMHIKQGAVTDEHEESPIFLIGGPGKVLVELDSIALFERADGTPHVIGPTGKEPGGKATIGGFERFREAIDIRDHYIELRDQDMRSLAVSSRSRDGIPIKATDVRLVFSLYRGNNPEPSAEVPYPYDKKALENIVYKAASQVTPEQTNPSTFKFSWTGNMVGLIRGRLGGFMSQHNLTEYLASTGLPEFEKAKEREDKIVEQMQRLAQTDDVASGRKDPKPPPDFQSRRKIKNLFAQFADDFTEQARNSGVELKWIGVGTWETPVNIVPEKHLEAWKLMQDNMKNDSPQAMSRIEQSEVVEKIKELIQKVPLDVFDDIRSGFKSSKKSGGSSSKKKQEYFFEDEEEEYDEFEYPDDDEEGKDAQFAEILNKLEDIKEDQEPEEIEPRDTDHAHDVQALLLEYRKQLQETVDFIKNKNESIPQNIRDAIKHIDNQIAHWAGRP